MANGNAYPAQVLDDDGLVRLDGTLQFTNSANQPNIPNPVTSGALSTATLSSGTPAQLSTARNVFAASLITYDGTNNVATCKVELSPDNVTFSALYTTSLAAAVNFVGAIALPVSFSCPAGWYVKITVVHASIGTVTYY